MKNEIDKLKELKLSEVNAKAIYGIISNYNNVEEVPLGETKSASFEQLFFPPFRRLLEKEGGRENTLIKKIATITEIPNEKVVKYLFECSDTYIPAIVKMITHLEERDMENLRDRTQQIIFNELKKYCGIENGCEK